MQGLACVWGLGTDGSWKRKSLTILTQSMCSFQLFIMNFRPLCEPLLVLQDVLGASGAELQQQKTVQNRDFPRSIREKNLQSITEPVVGEENKDTLWTM